MNEKTVESRLSSIEAKLDHTNKTVDQLMPKVIQLIERVIRLEERQGVLDLLPNMVAKNQVDGAINHAVQDEKNRSRDDLRKNMVLIVTIAGFVGSVVSMIGGFTVWVVMGG